MFSSTRNKKDYYSARDFILLTCPVLLFVFLTFVLGGGSAAPSSAWNQPALAINTINPSHETKKNMGLATSSNGHHPASKGKLVNAHSKKNEPEKKKTYTWNTIMHYGLSGGSDHNIRHKAKKLRDHSKLPCPFDQIRSWWDGKCRPAPRFSLYRVG